MKTKITIEIEDLPEGPRLTMKGDIHHGFEIMYAAMGYATWAITSDTPEYNEGGVSMQAGTWIHNPNFIDY